MGSNDETVWLSKINPKALKVLKRGPDVFAPGEGAYDISLF